MPGHHGPTCPQCGVPYRRRPVRAGERCLCGRCGAKLYGRSRLNAEHVLALAIAALIAYAVANSFPIVILSTQGLHSAGTLPESIMALWKGGRRLMAILVFLTAEAFPLIDLLAAVAISACLLWGRRQWSAALVRLARRLRPWGMTEVLLLGVVVSLVKLSHLAEATPGIGLWAFIALAVLLTVVQSVDLGRRPGEAHAVNGADSLSRTWALLTAAVILYVPANLLPIMKTSSLFGRHEDTIISGVVYFWTSGSPGLAALIFSVSILVPLMKMGALAYLAVSVQRHRSVNRRQCALLYRLVEFVGRWSMLDVFVVALMAGLVRFGPLMTVEAGPGALAFGTVVVLTMLASHSFDPHLIWEFRHAED